MIDERAPSKIKYQDVEHTYIEMENSVQKCKETSLNCTCRLIFSFFIAHKIVVTYVKLVINST